MMDQNKFRLDLKSQRINSCIYLKRTDDTVTLSINESVLTCLLCLWSSVALIILLATLQNELTSLKLLE